MGAALSLRPAGQGGTPPTTCQDPWIYQVVYYQQDRLSSGLVRETLISCWWHCGIQAQANPGVPSRSDGVEEDSSPPSLGNRVRRMPGRVRGLCAGDVHRDPEIGATFDFDGTLGG